MNRKLRKYLDYSLCTEMLETPEIIRNLPEIPASIIERIRSKKSIFLTGEGSSRLVPAKNMIFNNLCHGTPVNIFTEGATQALEYDLKDMAVIGVSNSGRTRELVRLFDHLNEKGHDSLIGITANPDTPLEERAHETIILGCGKENAVAATKSVVEQSLVMEQIIGQLTDAPDRNYSELANAFERVLDLPMERSIIEKLAKADMLYFAGRNTGVAEELTLKTNEIVRKKSDYLEGTYGVHGIEEVMSPNEAIIILDPYPEEEALFHQNFVNNIGMEVIAISSRSTMFPTIRIPEKEEHMNYLMLGAGWNLLVEVGLALDVNLDKPERARKIGNEYLV